VATADRKSLYYFFDVVEIRAAVDKCGYRTGIMTDRVVKELELVAFSRITDGVNGTDVMNGANGTRGVLGRGRLSARGPD
jgi:hypothetical protein